MTLDKFDPNPISLDINKLKPYKCGIGFFNLLISINITDTTTCSQQVDNEHVTIQNIVMLNKDDEHVLSWHLLTHHLRSKKKLVFKLQQKLNMLNLYCL